MNDPILETAEWLKGLMTAALGIEEKLVVINIGQDTDGQVDSLMDISNENLLGEITLNGPMTRPTTGGPELMATTFKVVVAVDRYLTSTGTERPTVLAAKLFRALNNKKYLDEPPNMKAQVSILDLGTGKGTTPGTDQTFNLITLNVVKPIAF